MIDPAQFSFRSQPQCRRLYAGMMSPEDQWRGRRRTMCTNGAAIPNRPSASGSGTMFALLANNAVPLPEAGRLVRQIT